MPLTPEDVSNKRFTPVRLREGYDMGEVDQFLDEVEAELGRLLKENDDLRERLRVAQENPPAAAPAPAPVPEPVYQAPTPPPEPEPEPVYQAPTPAAAPTPSYVQSSADTSGPMQEIRVTTVAEASSAAARLLEIATHNADTMVAQAKGDAEQILGDAKAQADRLEAEIKSRSDRIEADARSRAQMLDSETAERRNQLFGDLEREKGRLNTEIENLRAFEREYRSRLKSYFSQQLAALDTTESSPVASQAAAQQPINPPTPSSSLGGQGYAGAAAQPASSPYTQPATPSYDQPPAAAPSYDQPAEPRRLRSLLGDDEY